MTTTALPDDQPTEAPVRLAPIALPAIERYALLERVGAGAMGVVYAAYDSVLDRKVALKVLPEEQLGGAHRDQLLAEARALARLAHPNVVPVYDVGEAEGRVFFAMEFVRGQTLAAWLATPRAVDAIARAFAEAARGLAAAHAAGLVHRDVKPQNLLVGDDGRVRVADFGLAAPSGDGAVPGFAGTPAYMAPEQLRGAGADARADQFALGVALFEAVHGARPFDPPGDAPALRAGLLEAMARGPAPGARAVPAWLAAVIARALAIDPAARFPSCAALAEALEPPVRRRRRRWLAGGALVATSAAVAFLVRNPDIGPEPPPRCDAIADAALAPIWNPDRRAALTAALATDGADRAAHLVAQVDAYAAGWRGVREAACRSARLDHTWPTELEASATRCLDARGTALDRTVGALTTDPATRDAATDAISGLSGFRTCGDPDYLRSAVEVAIAPALRPRVTALMDRIEAAVLDVSLGRQAAVAAAIPALRAEAASLQHGPALAHLDILEGDMARAAGDLRLAIARHLAAYTAARAARDPVQATGAAIALIWDHGLLGEDTARATDWAAVAQAEVATLGDRGLAMSVAYAEGALADRRGDLAQATAHFERAVALATAEFGPDHFATAKVQGALASVLGAAGRFDEAIGPHRQAIATLERWEGPDGASLVRMLGNLALTEDSANQHAAAAADARRALAIAERDGDPERLGTAAHNLGVVLGNAGDHAAASLLFRRAEGTFRDAGLPGAAAGSVIARLLPGPDAGADARARREARAALTAARTAVVVAYGPDAPEVADADRALAAWAR